MKNAKFVFHRLYETIQELNKVRKNNQYANGFIKTVSDHVVKLHNEDPEKSKVELKFTILDWLEHAEDICYTLDHSFIQSPDDKVQLEDLTKYTTVVTNMYNFFESFKESMRLQYVLYKSPVKYRKTLIKLCRKQLAETCFIGSVINFDLLRKRLVDGEMTYDEVYENIRYDIMIASHMLDIYKNIEKSATIDFDVAWNQIESILRDAK